MSSVYSTTMARQTSGTQWSSSRNRRRSFGNSQLRRIRAVSDWFSPVRLAAFKDNTQLKAGHLPQARQTLQEVLDDLPPESDKQRTVILGDLAAVEAADGRPEEACRYAAQALDQLAITWYATGMDHVR